VDLLVDRIRAAAAAGVHLVQVRERDLEARALLDLVRACVEAVQGTRTRILVNDRLDVALACGAHGVHLRGDSFHASRIRAIAPAGFLIGRSIHSATEAAAEAGGGLDYLMFGNVFATDSKPGKPGRGVEELAAVVAATAVPVLAVGGVTAERAPAVMAAGAAGFAAIGAFI
jgi:thiamine-phosphate pyrophosphorylase